MKYKKKSSEQINGFKRQYKTPPEKFPFQTHGKDRRGNTKQIATTFLSDTKIRKPRQGSHEALLTDSPEYQKLVERVYEYLRDGVRSGDIFKELMMEDPEMTKGGFIKILNYAYKYAENTLHKDREYVFQLHMARYEEVYRESVSLEDRWHRPLDPVKDWVVMVQAYKAALKALKSKEDLLGLHDKTMVLEFNDHKAVVVEQENRGGAGIVAGFDLTKLNTDELLELLGLIRKARTVPIEGIQRVSIKTTKIEITQSGRSTVQQVTRFIDDVDKRVIEFDDMPSNVVEKFEDITKFEDAIVVEPNVIDDVPKEVREMEKKNVDDIKDIVRKNTLEEFRKKLRDK